MRPSLLRLSKASRKPLSSKHANKDYYKGSRVAQLPGGHRTGAPGQHTNSGGYKLDDTKVRVFVAPPLNVLNDFKLKPYVYKRVERPAESTMASFPLTKDGINGADYAEIIARQSSQVDVGAPTSLPPDGTPS